MLYPEEERERERKRERERGREEEGRASGGVRGAVRRRGGVRWCESPLSRRTMCRGRCFDLGMLYPEEREGRGGES